MTSATAGNSIDEASKNPTALFNGGKMNHIFEFEKGVERGPKLYIPNFACEEAKIALENGKLYYKIDGSNGMIIITKNATRESSDRGDTVENEGKEQKSEQGGDVQLHPYKRLDTKGKPPPEHCIQLPTANNPDRYEGHSYYYEPMPLNCKEKGLRKINKVVHQILNDHKDHIIDVAAATACCGDTPSYLSVEWIGRKFQKTPGVPHDIAIAIHSQQTCNNELNIERTYDGMRNFLLGGGSGENNSGAHLPIEGFIVAYNGTYWKIRSDCFDRKCSFTVNRESARPPIYLVPKES